MSEWLWFIIGMAILSPLWVYVLSKMVTFGILKAKSQFKKQTESEEKNGSQSP